MTYWKKWLTICFMNPEEQPLKRGTSLIYDSYKFCETCQQETTYFNMETQYGNTEIFMQKQNKQVQKERQVSPKKINISN